jgi:hypothetical protein
MTELQKLALMIALRDPEVCKRVQMVCCGMVQLAADVIRISEALQTVMAALAKEIEVVRATLPARHLEFDWTFLDDESDCPKLSDLSDGDFPPGRIDLN